MFNGGMGTLPLSPETSFSKNVMLQILGIYVTSIHFKNISYLQYFAILLNNNIMVAIKYLQTILKFEKI